MDLKKQKRELRLKMIELRDSIPIEKQLEWSDVIQLRVIEIIKEKSVQSVFCYMSIRSEVRTDKIIDYCLGHKIKVCIPKVDLQHKKMIAHWIMDPKLDVAPGVYDILEPTAVCHIARYEEIDMMIAPALAFDHHLNRLGYGGGYYDRFIQEVRHIYRLGIAYAKQIQPSLPVEEYDIPVHRIITEEIMLGD